jgi:hypothetical protein
MRIWRCKRASGLERAVPEDVKIRLELQRPNSNFDLGQLRDRLGKIGMSAT